MKGTILLLAALAGATGEDVSRELVVAASRGESARVAALLRMGADPDARDASGRPALLAAAASGRVEVVTALLRGGARPDPRAAGDRPRGPR